MKGEVVENCEEMGIKLLGRADEQRRVTNIEILLAITPTH